MTQCNSLNVKLSHSQLNKLKLAISGGTDVVSRLSSNMFQMIKVIFLINYY